MSPVDREHPRYAHEAVITLNTPGAFVELMLDTSNNWRIIGVSTAMAMGSATPSQYH